MAVGLRGYVQLAWYSSGSATLAWPGGTAAGDLALCWTSDLSGARPDPDGWEYVGTDTWQKILTAGDIAGDLEVTGKLVGLVVLTGASRVGNKSQQSGVTVGTGGAAYFNGWTRPYYTSLAGATYRLGTTVTEPDGTTNASFLRTGATGYVQLDSVASRTYWRGYEIVQTEPPDAPTLLAPAAGAEMDRTVDTVFSVQHNSTQSGGTQEQIKVRLRAVSTGTWYYVLADGTMSTTETALTQSSGLVTLNAIESAVYQLAADQAYEWGASTMEADSWSDWSASQQFTARNPPTVDSITVTSPAQDLTPLIEWTMTAGTGTQAAWQVRVCTSGASADAPLWDSLVQSGADLSVTAPAVDSTGATIWTNAENVYAWVRVQQSGGLWSAWTVDNVTFAVTWTAPDAPASVTAANQASGPLQVTATGYDAAADGLLFEWSLDGSTYTSLVTVETPDTSETVDVPLAEYGTARYYRARCWETVDGVDLPSAWTVIASPVASTDTRGYVVAQDGADYLAVVVHEDSTRTLVQGMSTHYGLGATSARVDRSPSAGESGQTALTCLSLSERQALESWLDAAEAFWMRWTPEGGLHVPSTLMARTSPVTTDRPAQVASPERWVRFAWVEQAA